MSGRHALGIHIGHDRGAALVSDGVLVAHIAEERLDRRKHSDSAELPLRSIEAVLATGRVRPSDLGMVGISYLNVEIGKIAPLLRDELRDALGCPSLDVKGVGHHDCHAWSSFCTADAAEALILVADGSGDVVDGRLEAESVYLGSGDTITLVDRRLQDFGTSRMTRRNSYVLAYMAEADRGKSISLGNKYEQFTYLAGFGHREAGKLMGLAAYAEPLFTPEVPTIGDLQFPLHFETGLVEIDHVWRRSGEPWHSFVRGHAAGIAASGQRLLEDYMLALLNALNPDGAHRTLCAAGGVFLNCQMNGRILLETRFEELHVIPAAGDDGQSIGAAFDAYRQAFGAVRRGSRELPFLGPCYDATPVEAQLRDAGFEPERLGEKALMERTADALERGLVIGLLRGRSETGPRALCHRSILADPRRPEMKDYLNRLKGRELFRPFAPVITAEDQARYFELIPSSPYMLLATRLHAPYRPLLPAIVHVDGSSRIQAVSRDKEPFVHGLLRAFEARTGHPVLLNTSFNLAGEPIVETPADAIATFLRSRLDVLVIGNWFVERSPVRPRPSASVPAASRTPSLQS